MFKDLFLPYIGYYLRIVSGKRAIREDQCGISCQLICKNGKTDPFPLHGYFDLAGAMFLWLKKIVLPGDCPAMYADVSVIVLSEDLGPLLGIAFYAESNHSGSWFLSYVVAVSQSGDTELFPAYKWLQKGDQILTTSKTCKL